MELTLKHISQYLPYELECINTFCSSSNSKWTVTGITVKSKHTFIHLAGSSSGISVKFIKPILRPLSDLQYERLTWGELVLNQTRNNGDEHLITSYAFVNTLSYGNSQWLFENHFDIFGLIEKGLAIDINSIKQ